MVGHDTVVNITPSLCSEAFHELKWTLAIVRAPGPLVSTACLVWLYDIVKVTTVEEWRSRMACYSLIGLCCCLWL